MTVVVIGRTRYISTLIYATAVVEGLTDWSVDDVEALVLLL
jgi:hypothetical protein